MYFDLAESYEPFAPLQSIIQESLDEFFRPRVDRKFRYLLEEDKTRTITPENLEMGIGHRETKYLHEQMFSDWYEWVTEFSRFATTGEKNIDEIFADPTERTLHNFAQYLNDYDKKAMSVLTDGRPYCTRYLPIEGKIYLRHKFEPATQYELLSRYINKNLRHIIVPYMEEWIEMYNNPLK